MIPLFAESFRVAQQLGLGVIVTMSHSAPYHADTPADAIAFIKAWTADHNIDALSPQLYTTGTETAPVLDETSYCKEAGCSWLLFVNSAPKFVPSIVNASHYPAVQKFFAGAVDVAGYIEWEQHA